MYKWQYDNQFNDINRQLTFGPRIFKRIPPILPSLTTVNRLASKRTAHMHEVRCCSGPQPGIVFDLPAAKGIVLTSP